MMNTSVNNITSGAILPFGIGVDVGGTKIAASLVDLKGSILQSSRRPTDTRSPQATLDCIADAIEDVIRESQIKRQDIRGIGLGIPGLVDPERGIGVAAVNLGWENVPVKAELETRLDIPCAIENDVKAATYGEARFGSGRGLKNMIYLSIGTGIAAGVFLEGKLYRGQNGLAGEIGHASIDRNGPRCKCGGRGCLEALAAGPAIAARAEEKIRAGRKSILSSLIQPENYALTSEKVFEAAEQRDPVALETLDEVGASLAFGIQLLALAYDPALIVIGGGVAERGNIFINPIRRHLEIQAAESWVFNKIYKPDTVQLSRLGKEIGVLGAAALIAPATS